MSTNLGFTQMTENQASPELTHNQGLAEIDAVLTETFVVDVSAGNATVSDDHFKHNLRFVGDGAAVARDITLPAFKHLIILEADVGNTADVTFKRGTATIVLPPGERVVAFTDGTTNGLISLTVAVASSPYDINLWIRQKPAAGAVVLSLRARRAFEFEADFAGSSVDADAASTSTKVFTFTKNGTPFGTATFTSSDTGVLDSTAASFAIDDVFEIEAPASQDATLSGIRFNILGTKV